MLSKNNILHFLLEEDRLWQSETRHEALLLFKSIYKSFPEQRDKLTDYVLLGPPLLRSGSSEVDELRFKEYPIFTILEYLKKDDLELTKNGCDYFAKIKKENPEWRLQDDADILNPIHTKQWVNPFTVEEIYSKSPQDVAFRMRDHKETKFGEFETHAFCSTVGATCRKYPDWGIKLFLSLKEILTELPIDTINPIIWELRSTDEKETLSWNLEQIGNLNNILNEMTEKRRDAKLWTSLPSLLENWQKTYKVGLDFWGNLASKLSNIFMAFDYEREEKKEPIEWIQKAANHPYGDLTELYFKCAYQKILEQEEAGIKYEIDSKIIHYFEFIINNYDRGTRYGLCIIGRWMSWLEAIIPDWVKEKLVPVFYWNGNKEMALVAWSGYLWDRTVSRFLSEDFNSFFIETVKRYKMFGKDEQEGLTTHVAALAWFNYIDLSSLEKFSLLLDYEGRIHMLGMLRQHLSNAPISLAESFWNNIIIPFWDWFDRQHYLQLPIGNSGRNAFWNMLPYSYQVFPKAILRAIRLAPSRFEHIYMFTEEILKNDYSISYPEEFTNFLLALLQADQNPEWNNDRWEKLWVSIKDSGTKKVGKLRDELARKKLIDS